MQSQSDTETIEHLREITIRQAERIERLESELIKERAHSRRLTDEIVGREPFNGVRFLEHHPESKYVLWRDYGPQTL